ncbi:MAG: hypothetical protein QM778_08020 [Myxococcales bacterium]
MQKPKDDRQAGGPGGEHGSSQAANYQLGDLDIPAARSRATAQPSQRGLEPVARAPAPVPPPPRASSELDAFGARDFGEDAFGDGTELELDEPALRRPAPAPRPAAAGHAPAKPGTVPQASGPRGNAALGSSVPRDANANMLVELQELGGFGDPPTGWVSSGRYAIHVAIRLLSLRAERKRAVKAQQVAESNHRTALEELGQVLAAAPSATPALKSFHDAVLAALHQVSQADQTLSRARDESRGALEDLAKSRATLEQQLQPFVEAESAAQTAVRKAEEDLKRGQAWLKRVEIELRALQETETEAEPAKLANLEQQKAQRQAAVSGFEAALLPVMSKLELARRELEQRRAAVHAIDRQRQELEAGARAKETSIGKQTEAAGEGHRHALRALAEAARERGLDGESGAAAQARVSLERVDDAKTEINHLDRARDLYDHAGARNGALLLLAILVFGLVVLYLQPGMEPG